jgi:3-hydroxyacyl-CoA dehydrogenase
MSTSSKEAITRVAVIGVGTMGAAIAQHFLMKSLEVLLLDVSGESLERGIGHIRTSLMEAVGRGILKKEAMNALLDNLKWGTDYELLADRQHVVEALFLNMQVKQQIFRQVEKYISPTRNTVALGLTGLPWWHVSKIR